MKIRVTRRDIKSGTRRDPWSCPVARAILRKTGVACCACPDAIRRSDLPRLRAETPREVQKFIKAYDARGAQAVKPFEFELPDDLFAKGES